MKKVFHPVSGVFQVSTQTNEQRTNKTIYSNALNIDYYHFLLVISQVNIRMKLEKQTAQNASLVSIVHALIQI